MRLNSVKTFFLLSVLTVFFVFIGGLVGGRGGAMIAFGFAVVMNFFSYWFSASIVLKLYKAREITEVENPELYGMVRKLATVAKLPMPKVCIIQNPTPNAFATGRNPANGVVAVTTGIMQLLNKEELEGVIAHELAHIGNRDILIGTIAATIAGAVMMLASMARWGAILGGGNKQGGLSNNIVIALALSIIAPIAAMIVQMAVSRTREYEADASAARLTKNPNALASALNKISSGVERVPMDTANPATAHMFIMNPFSGKKALNLFSTHPAVEDRIKRLQAMDRSSGGAKQQMVNNSIRSQSGQNQLFR
jgi:heat shock protein HtpX